jgi:cytoskeleton protein RodZ
LTERNLTGVGADLRRAREAAGLGMAEVAQRLKLLPRQIESLEQERFDRLPGPTIARGMVRNYAQLLGLDPEPLVARMSPGAGKAAEAPADAPPRERAPSSVPGRRSTPLYVGFLVVLLVVAGVAAYEWQREQAAPDTVVAVPPAPPPAAVEAPPPVVEEPPVEKPAEQPVEQPVAKETEAPALAEAPAEPQPKPKPAAQPALPAGVHRLVLRMQEEAWLEVRDGAGTSLVASLNPAGTERVVRGQPPFQLVIGNAAHVELSNDGKPVDLKPHTRGEVARFTLR